MHTALRSGKIGGLLQENGNARIVVIFGPQRRYELVKGVVLKW
jgi:hypothetical protein